MIAERIKELHRYLPSNVQLVAVSKFHSSREILEAYEVGQRVFGENHVQEMTAKYEILPKDIEWHMIGHLQTNKVKYIAPFVSMIHSVDSFKLLAEIDKIAKKNHRVIDCLLQIHIAEEETKFGFSFDECRDLLMQEDWKSLCNVKIRGLMGMATLTDNQKEIIDEFSSLKSFFNEIKNDWFKEVHSFDTLSMGMSNDYKLAIQSGSTMVRIGTTIFGERDYSRKDNI